MRYFVLFSFLVACNSSNKEPCNYGGIDYIFLAHYQNCLTIVGQYQMGNDKVTSRYFSQALTVLEAITDIESSAYRGDSTGYMSDEEYYKDLNEWSDWYAKNMHDFSFEDAHNKFEEYRKTNQEELSWPPMLIDIMVNPN